MVKKRYFLPPKNKLTIQPNEGHLAWSHLHLADYLIDSLLLSLALVAETFLWCRNIPPDVDLQTVWQFMFSLNTIIRLFPFHAGEFQLTLLVAAALGTKSAASALPTIGYTMGRGNLNQCFQLMCTERSKDLISPDIVYSRKVPTATKTILCA